ncbi:hypothetical protein ZTR_02470 [Talaromyces verruculosus]|nr:hypothetical protein ZTR_02470 [Talaromyces verruculosus]
MTAMPRSFVEFSPEEVEAEENYAEQNKLNWEPEVEMYARDFYRDVTAPRPDEPLEIFSTVKLDEERYRCIFEVRLWEVRGSNRSLLNWDMPGQVEVTYIPDGIEWRKKTINLRLEARDGAESVGIFIDDWDDVEEDLGWERYLLILIKFDEGTIRYYHPHNPYETVVVGDVIKRHYEIYSSPQASRGCEFEDFGYICSEPPSPENQEQSSLSEWDESSMSY